MAIVEIPMLEIALNRKTASLEGKVAVVTGGSRGIGHSLVRHLVERGCRVVFTHRNSCQAAQQLMEACPPGEVHGIRADVRDLNVAFQVVKSAKDLFGRVDILVNNAGVIRDNHIRGMSEEDWAEVVDTSLRGSFNYSKAVTPLLQRQMSGRIINITSISGTRGVSGQANYGAAKAGMIGMTKSLARELGPFGVTVNAVAPGYIETDMLSGLKPEYRSKMIDRTPLGRFGTTEDVAAVVAFLASDEAAFITGQVLAVDGGLGI
jgi:3-oxoacyl-[acyl-carrier protein] reductase